MADSFSGSLAEVNSGSVVEALRPEVQHWRREVCPGCSLNTMFYCPHCCKSVGTPVGVHVPTVRLPFGRCDIIFNDKPSSSTGIHAKILAPTQVRLIDLYTKEDFEARRVRCAVGGEPSDTGAQTATIREVPDYDAQSTVVLFPDERSCPFDAIDADMVPLSEMVMVVIDATWRRAQHLRTLPQLANLRSVRLKAPPQSRFWRYHSNGPGCLSTIEALAALAREMDMNPMPSIKDAAQYLGTRSTTAVPGHEACGLSVLPLLDRSHFWCALDLRLWPAVFTVFVCGPVTSLP